MLKKLLKYDLLSIYKILIIFYILSVISAILTRLLFNIDNSTIFNILAQISSGFTISMIANILINNIMRVWHRFKSNLYDDEAYLTHTLPVSKTSLYLSKFISSIVSMFTSIIIIVITLFIAYYSKENLEIIKNLLLPLATIYDSTMINLLLVIFIVLFLQFTTILQTGFFGIIMGHRHNKNKMILSIIYGITSYIVIQIISLITIFIIGIFNQNIMNLFITNTIDSANIIKNVMYIVMILYISFIAILYCINTFIFKKGVNIN